MSTHHLAQLNIGRMVAPTDSPLVAEFMNAVDEINALADTDRAGREPAPTRSGVVQVEPITADQRG